MWTCIYKSLYIYYLATRNKCIASSNKCLTSNNKKLLETIYNLYLQKPDFLFFPKRLTWFSYFDFSPTRDDLTKRTLGAHPENWPCCLAWKGSVNGFVFWVAITNIADVFWTCSHLHEQQVVPLVTKESRENTARFLVSILIKFRLIQILFHYSF